MPPSAGNSSSGGGSGPGYRPLNLEQQQQQHQHHQQQQQARWTLDDDELCMREHDLLAEGDFYGQTQKQLDTARRRSRLRHIACAAFGGLLLLFVVVAGTVTLQRQVFSSSSGSSPADAAGALATRGSSKQPVVSGSSSSSSHTATAAAAAGVQQQQQGLWNEGGEFALNFSALAAPYSGSAGGVPCVGPDLQCGVANRLPVPEADFRGLPRRLVARRGVVAADSSRCSQLGRDVLVAGGHAVDAAVTVALCQGVVNPMASGLGGGAFINVRLANGTAAFWDARETAPSAATRDMFAGRPANASLFGGLAAAVPGELLGLEAAWRRFGRRPWAELVRPVARLAASGFGAHPYLVQTLSAPATLARILASPQLREAFLIPAPGDSKGSWRVPHVGERCCRRPELAKTLEQIAVHGAAYLASPAVTAAHAAELAAAGGIITAADLAAAAPAELPLLRVPLGDLELLVPPPPSSAAVVAFILRFLAGYGGTRVNATTATSSSSNMSFGAGVLAAAAEGGDAAAAAADGADGAGGLGLGLHRLVEAMKHGFAVRTALGDPGPPGTPFPGAANISAAVADLLSDEFAAALRAQTRDDGVLRDEEYGGRWNPEGVAPPEEHGTSHFCVVDKDRNAVSLTSSINTVFGSGVVSPTTGVLFGNTMDDFASPAKRTLVTPHPSEANFIAPGKRPLSAMSPIIAVHKASGRLAAVAGASGGPLIVSATTQTLARLLLEGADVAPAVAMPRLHDQLLPVDDAFFEDYAWGRVAWHADTAGIEALRGRGQKATPANRGIGVSQAVAVDYSGKDGGAAGTLVAVSDARKDGAPVGYS